MVEDWVVDELRHVQLGDMRRNRRLGQLVSDLVAHAGASIPQASANVAATKGAYRFLASPRIDTQAIREAHQKRTVERISDEQVLLVMQDTTELDYTAHPGTRGLGPLSGPGQQGLLAHTALAVSADGVPLGVLAQQVWVRDPQQTGLRHERRKREYAEKESHKWQDAEATVLDALSSEQAVVLIGDREADIYDYFVAERRAQAYLLVRATHNRKVGQEPGYLWDVLEAQEIAEERTITLARSGQRPARAATLRVRWARVQIQPPRHHKQRASQAPVSVVAVLVREENPPAGEEAICWLLLSTLPVQTCEDAWRVVRWYMLRWLIERYHFVLKSGCRIEHLQLETAERLQRALAVCAVVAWRLLWLTYLSRDDPDAPCDAVLAEHEWKALCCHTHRTRVAPEHPPTLREATRWIAQLGGFLGRTHDGDPGVQTLWRGLTRLSDIADTWLLFHTGPPGSG